MFDMGMSHLVVIAVVGVLVLGPEKLPAFLRDAARVWRTVRGLATDAQLKVTEQLLPDVPEEVRSLRPRQLAAHLLFGDDPDPQPVPGPTAGRRQDRANP